MLTFDITSNIDEIEKYLNNIQRKTLPTVIKKTIDKTMFQVKDQLEENLEKSLKSPTKFTKKFLAYYKSSKNNLIAGVFIKDRQAEYLYYQIHGGVRLPNKKSLLTPTKATGTKLNKHGNLTTSKKNKLFNQANTKSGKRAKVFIGKPKGSSLPYAVYKSVKTKNSSTLTPQLFLYKAIRYKKTFRFYRVAVKTTQNNLEKNFNRYMKEEGLF